MRINVLVVLAVVCGCGFGCDRDSSQSQPPLESFKAFAPQFLAAAREACLQTPWVERHTDGTIANRLLRIYEKYDLDVRKTDSLVSPYVGIITTTALQADGNHKTLWGTNDESTPLVLTFAYQDGKWVLKSAVVQRYCPPDGSFYLEKDYLHDADIIDPSVYRPFEILKTRLQAASQQAGGG